MLHVDIQFLPFVEEAVLSPLNILAPLLQIIGGCMWLSIPGFSSLFYMSVFMPVALFYRSCEGPSCVDQSWQCVSAQSRWDWSTHLRTWETCLAQGWAGREASGPLRPSSNEASSKGSSRRGSHCHHFSLILGHRPQTRWSSHFWFIHWGGKVELWTKNSRRLAASWDMLWFSRNILRANKGNHPKVYRKS